MNTQISLLDCTLRDGAYITGARFGEAAIKGIIHKMQDAGVDIIECGWLKDDSYEQGTTFYHVPTDLEQYLIRKDRKRIYVAMIDWDRYDVSHLPEYNGKSIDAIRVVFPHGKHREAIEIGNQIKEKGYKIFFQAANTLAYSEDDLIDLVEAMNVAEPVGLSVVDTFGAMYPEDLERIVKILHEHLKSSIGLGFHSHNNQQLSYALTMEFIRMLQKGERNIIVDASLCGMGRGAGNATTELVVSFLNSKCGCHYDMDAIMDAIDVYMEYFMENYEWGYSTPYFIAGLYCCHVNNISYLLKNHRTNSKDLRNIIESLSAEDRRKYDYDLLEQKYVKNQSYYVDDTETIKYLVENFLGRRILLIAPGKSALNEQDRIKAYISEKNPIVLGVNAILPEYQYDYVIFANPARYEYAKEAYAEQFESFKHIIFSNVKNIPDSGELIIGFNNVIKRGWEHFDNAMICSLRLMDLLGIKKVAIAGFDGFSSKYNESYADVFLPSLNLDNKWDELNEEIKEIFSDFKLNTVNCKEINFITKSIFEDWL